MFSKAVDQVSLICQSTSSASVRDCPVEEPLNLCLALCLTSLNRFPHWAAVLTGPKEQILMVSSSQANLTSSALEVPYILALSLCTFRTRTSVSSWEKLVWARLHHKQSPWWRAHCFQKGSWFDRSWLMPAPTASSDKYYFTPQKSYKSWDSSSVRGTNTSLWSWRALKLFV